MRAVVDTNVIVSAAIRGDTPPGVVVRAWLEGGFEALTSAQLIAELEGVLARTRIAERLGWSSAETASFVAGLVEAADVINPDVTLDVVQADPADNRVLETALAGEADYIVSGDQHLLALGSFEGIEIVTPARFAAILSTGSGI